MRIFSCVNNHIADTFWLTLTIAVQNLRAGYLVVMWAFTKLWEISEAKPMIGIHSNDFSGVNYGDDLISKGRLRPESL